ncbi:MAG: glycosyltransferase [Bacillota bacterium]|nr:glycosyltransferase [Bacillota bacterium]
MLADVIKQREAEKAKLKQEEINKYNHPYKRDTLIYFQHLYKLGGIQTWIQNLGLRYDFSVVYDFGDIERIQFFESMGIECIKYVGQEIECNTLITCIFGNPEKIKAKEVILAVHGDYKALPIENIPKHDKAIAVSKLAANSWKEQTGEDCEVLYTPVDIYEGIRPLIIGVFSRLSKEKGKKRVELLANKLIESKRPFFMLVFSDFPIEVEDERIKRYEPVMNPHPWMSICDYICQLSDTEAAGLTILEALKMGKPVIVTKLPVLEEFGVNKSNAKILDFDMSNLNVEDLWNIPVVKDYDIPDKDWDKYLKRKDKKYEKESV